MMTKCSITHLNELKKATNHYLQSKNVIDYNKYVILFKGDNKIDFMRWGYTGIPQPTIESLETLIPSIPKRSEILEMAYIYIYNAELLKRAEQPHGGGIDSVLLRQPIYYNVNGDYTTSLENIEVFKRNSNIESILNIEVDDKPKYQKRLSVDNGLLRYKMNIAREDIEGLHDIPGPVTIKVLILYQRTNIHKTKRIVNAVNTIYPLNAESLNLLRN